MNIVDKIIFPSKITRLISGIIGSTLGYSYSVATENIALNVDDLPQKIHIAPTLICGAIGSTFPILPVCMATTLLGYIGNNQYTSWKKRVISNHINK